MPKQCLLKRIICFIIILAMSAGSAGAVSESAQEMPKGVIKKVLTVCDDTYLRPIEPDENYNGASDLTFHQNKTQEVWVRFDLSKLKLPAGYEVDYAVCSLNISSVWGGNSKTEYTVALNSLSSSIYNPLEITYNNRNNIKKKDVLGIVTCEGDGTKAYTGNVSFDINDRSYLNAQLDEGYIAFSVTTTSTSVGGIVDSKEKANGTPATLTVVCKEKTDDTIYASDSAVINQNFPDDPDVGAEYSIFNAGSSKYNKRAYFKFDLSNLIVPQNKVIRSATMKLYFTDNWDKKENIVRIYNIEDNSWSSETISWNNNPGLPADNYSGSGVVPYEAVSVDTYVAFDVTAYISKCYANGFEEASFAAYPDAIKTNGALYLASHNADKEYQPKLEIVYGDETEFTFEAPQFYNGTLSDSVKESLIRFVVLPTVGATKIPVRTTLFVAQYDSKTHRIVKVKKKDVELYSSNGDSAYITTMVIDKTFEDCYMKAFLFTNELVPITDSEQTISAFDGPILAYNFSRNVCKKGNIIKLDSKLSMKDGNAMAPISFFDSILGAKIIKDSEKYVISLNEKSIVVESDGLGYSKNNNAEAELFKTAPFIKNEVLYLPLAECIELLGGRAKTFGHLTVIGNKNVIKAYENDEELVEEGGILVASETVNPETVKKADWENIKKKWRRSLIGDENNELGNPMVVDVVERISKEGRSAWSQMNKNSETFALFGSSPVVNSGDMTAQYEKIEALANAYGTYGSELYMDEQLKEDIFYALEWGYQNLYGDDEIENKGWRDTTLHNWWDWSVGVPEALCNALIIMEPEMNEDDVKKYLEPARKFLAGSSEKSESRSYIGTITAVLAEDANAMNAMVKDYNNILQFRDEGPQGFRKDFTYIMHSYFPYNGQYGVGAVLDRIGRIQPILTDTPFEFATPYIYNTALWFYNSFEPILYKGRAMAAFNGRYPMNEARNGGTAIGVALQYIDTFGPDDDKKLKDMIRRNVTEETLSAVKNQLTVNEATILSRVLSEKTSEPEKYTRAKVYARGDRVIQQRNGYAFAVSMSSERIATYETSQPSANLTGWYTSDGMVYMYTDSDFEQYNGVYWQNSNPYHRPGTTVDTQPREAVVREPWLPDTAFVGAVEFEGEYATAAMDFKAYGNGDEEDHNSTLNAKKAWFLFDDELVALGTGINSNDGFDVHTVVENRRISDKRIVNGNASAVKTIGDKKVITEPTWVHMEDVAGYYFPQGGELVLQKNDSNSDFVEMWLDHGKNPENKEYAYVLLPHKDNDETKAYAEEPDISILANTKKLQAVRENTIEQTGIVFWERGSFAEISVSEPLIIMKQEKDGEYIISFCDPTQKLENAVIKLDKALEVTNYDREISIESTESSVIMSVDLKEAKGKTFTVRFLAK